MTEEIIYYLTRYGYLAIFILIFLQEIGMPNIFPNEILLIFSGILSVKEILSFPFIIITAITADFAGTNFLFFLFYYSGNIIMYRIKRWIPATVSKIEKLGSNLQGSGLISIYIFRITPFTRGYTSVITGLLRMSPRLYLPIAFITSIIWSMFYVMVGRLLGPSWDLLSLDTNSFRLIMIAILLISAGTMVWLNFPKKKLKNQTRLL